MWHSSTELNGLVMRKNQLEAAKKRGERLTEEKNLQLEALEQGIAEAGNNSDDYKLLKARLCSLSEQFLHGEGKKAPGKSKSTTNAEKLQSMDAKISGMKAALEKKKASHAKEMRRLVKENAILMEVSWMK